MNLALPPFSGAVGNRASKSWTYGVLALVASASAALVAWGIAGYAAAIPGGSKDVEILASLLLKSAGPFQDAARLGVSTLFLMAIPLSALLVLALGAVGERLARKLDPDDISWTSIAWALRSLPGMLFWALICATAGFIVDRLWPGVEEWIGIGLALAFALACGFAGANPRNLEATRPPWLWKPGWPGLAAILLALLWCLVMWGLEIIEPVFDAWLGTQASATRLVGSLLVFVLAFAWVIPRSVLLFAWLNKQRLQALPHVVSRACSRRAIGPQLASDLRLCLLGFALALPLLAASLVAIYFAPQMEALAESGGRPVPQSMFTLLEVHRWFLGYGLLVLLPAGAWLTVVLNARIYVASGMLEPQAGEPSGLRSSNQSPAQSLASS